MHNGNSSVESPTSTDDQCDTAAQMPATEEVSDPNSTNSQDSSDSQETRRYPVRQRRPPSHLKDYVSSQEIHRNKN